MGSLPRNPQYKTYFSRIISFAGWPLFGKPSEKNLAEAGFHYTGKGDRVMCFQCGGGLRDWDLTDDPWVEHAIHFPRCAYLAEKKGQEYISRIQNLLAISNNQGAENQTENLGDVPAPATATAIPITDFSSIAPIISAAPVSSTLAAGIATACPTAALIGEPSAIASSVAATTAFAVTQSTAIALFTNAAPGSSTQAAGIAIAAVTTALNVPLLAPAALGVEPTTAVVAPAISTFIEDLQESIPTSLLGASCFQRPNCNDIGVALPTVDRLAYIAAELHVSLINDVAAALYSRTSCFQRDVNHYDHLPEVLFRQICPQCQLHAINCLFLTCHCVTSCMTCARTNLICPSCGSLNKALQEISF